MMINNGKLMGDSCYQPPPVLDGKSIYGETSGGFLRLICYAQLLGMIDTFEYFRTIPNTW